MLTIRPINRKKSGNRYCGPAAISAITGCTTDDAALVLRHVTSRRAIKGTTSSDLIIALRAFGLDMYLRHEYRGKARPTFARWIEESRSMRSAGRVLIVNAGWHWQVISGRRTVCSITQEVVGFDHPKVRRRARVAAVYEVLLPRGATSIKRPTSILETTKARSSADATGRRKLRALAAKHGIELDTSDSQPGNWCVWVYPPEGLYANEDDDPYCGSRFCSHWNEALEIVKHYAAEAAGKEN